MNKLSQKTSEVLKNKIFLMQIFCNISPAFMLLFANKTQASISFVVFFLTGCLGMSITYHRLVAHKSFETHQIFKTIGLFLGTIGLTGSALAWCAIHKEHHRTSDTQHDPHSPHQKSFFWVQFLSMFYTPKIKYIKPFIGDGLVVFFHKNYFRINLTYALLLLYLDPFAIIYAYLFPAFLLWHGGSAINSFGHLSGYANYNTSDKSKNNLLLGYFMWGEGWHNNHHKFPSQPNNQRRWFEIDMSFWIISVIKKRYKAS